MFLNILDEDEIGGGSSLLRTQTYLKNQLMATIRLSDQNTLSRKYPIKQYN